MLCKKLYFGKICSFVLIPAMAAVFQGTLQSARADSLVSWGDNTSGDLGDGTTTDSTSPVFVQGMTSGVTAVAGGGFNSVAVQNGGVFTWGDNSDGQLGVGSTVTGSMVPVAVPGLSSGVTAIASGAGQSFAIKDGAVYAWGLNANGQVGIGTTTNSFTPQPVAGLGGGVTSIAGGFSHSLAVMNGAVYAWGEGAQGEMGVGNDVESDSPEPVAKLTGGATKVAAGEEYSMALVNGGVYTWGDNYWGELGDGTKTPTDVPNEISSLSSGVTDIAAGGAFALALQNGSVYAWGNNNFGDLGMGDTTNRFKPVQVDPTDLHGIVALAAGFGSSYALAADGSLWVWGYNQDGELGLGFSSASFDTPQHLLPPKGFLFTSIDSDANGGHVLASLALVPEPASLWLLLPVVMLLPRRATRLWLCSD